MAQRRAPPGMLLGNNNAAPPAPLNSRNNQSQANEPVYNFSAVNESLALSGEWDDLNASY